jgi:23S rRNA U2552 (ribose-2'-O)-methylase RlmE/FtsJ
MASDGFFPSLKLSSSSEQALYFKKERKFFKNIKIRQIKASRKFSKK